MKGPEERTPGSGQRRGRWSSLSLALEGGVGEKTQGSENTPLQPTSVPSSGSQLRGRLSCRRQTVTARPENSVFAKDQSSWAGSQLSLHLFPHLLLPLWKVRGALSLGGNFNDEISPSILASTDYVGHWPQWPATCACQLLNEGWRRGFIRLRWVRPRELGSTSRRDLRPRGSSTPRAL